MTEPDIVRVIDDLKHCDGRHRNIGQYTFDNAIEAIEQLRKERDEALRERDEARQRLCKVVGDARDMWGEDVAKEYGWDCFKETP
jgi:hypothetical protein